MKRVLQYRKILSDLFTAHFYDQQIEDFDLLVELCAANLPKKVDEDSLRESLRSLLGTVMTAQVIEKYSHLLAGNVDRLERHRPIHPWVVQRFNEWAVIQVLRVEPQTFSKKGKIGNRFHFKVMTGTACPMRIERWVSRGQAKIIAHKIGFSRHRGERQEPVFPYARSDQLVTLRMLAYLDRDLSLGKKEPSFELTHVRGNAPCIEYNREQLKYRFRMGDQYACPEDYPRSVPCHACWRGYETCRAGTHRKDYEVQPCPVCKDPEAVFDPEVTTPMCVVCFRKDSLKRK